VGVAAVRLWVEGAKVVLGRLPAKEKGKNESQAPRITRRSHPI
jgi:hypothetical protein